MPRVSAQHLEARREEILQAAWRCFSRKGFHSSTMADVIAESGLSAGAVYRYFTGKEDLVRATVERAIGQTGGVIDVIVDEGEPDLAIGLAGVLEAFSHLWSGDVDVSRVALMAWAEGLQNEPVHEIVLAAQQTLRERLARLARRAQAAGNVGPDADPDAIAQLLLSLVIGLVVQRLVFRGFDVPPYVQALAAIRDARLG